MTKPIKILLVEDNLGDVVLLKELFKGLNFDFEIIHVTKLVKAIKVLFEEKIDMVLLDLSLPDSTGVETYQLMKNHTDKPIIILTGFPEGLYRQFIESEIHPPPYLNKENVNPEKLKQTINKALN